MKRLCWLAGWIALVAIAQGADAPQPFQRALSQSAHGGWVQVRLDSSAQLHADSLWIGDERGQSVPFLREEALASTEVSLRVQDLVTGRDDDGRAVAEFSLARPEGGAIDPSEPVRTPAGHGFGFDLPERRKEMTFTLEVQAEGPWAADVEVASEQAGGGWINEPDPQHVYDFGAGRRALEIKVQHIAPRWRVRLKTLRGEIRGVRAVSGRAVVFPRTIASRRSVLGVAKHADHWTLTLPQGPERVVAVHLQLQGTVAPVSAELARLDDEPYRKEERATWAGAALVWELPGLSSRAGAVRLTQPALAERFRLKLPAGVEVLSAEAEIAGESLWFVAEKGRAYSLHLAGVKRPAPGDLSALPPMFDRRMPEYLTIGPPMDDPQAQAVQVSLTERLRGWLPWLVGAAVAALAVVALALLRAPRREA